MATLTDLGFGPLCRQHNEKRIDYQIIEIAKTLLRITTSACLVKDERLWIDTRLGTTDLKVSGQLDQKDSNVYRLGLTPGHTFDFLKVAEVGVGDEKAGQMIKREGQKPTMIRNTRFTETLRTILLASSDGAGIGVFQVTDFSRTGMRLTGDVYHARALDLGAIIELSGKVGRRAFVATVRVVRRGTCDTNRPGRRARFYGVEFVDLKTLAGWHLHVDSAEAAQCGAA